jgi:ElaB/YqjD/DUF883 family membrane-anchored ribosome-binding protein
MRDDTTFASDPRKTTQEQRPEAAGITDAAKKVSEGLGELTRALNDGRQNLVEPMSQFIQQRPLAAVGVAFGIGYILGGGLFTRTTGRLIGVGWRLGGMALAKNLLGNLADHPGSRF